MRPFGYLSPERFTLADIETSEGFDCEEVFGQGHFQKGIALFTLITMWVMHSHTLAFALVSADVDHWCRQPNEVNLSANAWKNIAIPLDADWRHSRCTVYASPGDPNDTRVVECDAWHYDPERANSSIVAEWNLVCRRRSLKALATGIVMPCAVGFLVLSGYCADRFGRLPVVQSSAAGVIVATVGCCLAKSYPVYVAARLLVSGCTFSLYTVSGTILAECCSFASRPAFLSSAMVGVMLAETCFTVLKQLPHLHWFRLQLIMIAPTLLVSVGFFLVAESPRWLIASRRLHAAESVMLDAAKSNGGHHDHVALLLRRVQQRLQEGATSPSVLSADMMRVVRRRAVIMFGSSFSVMIPFYSLFLYQAGRRAAAPWIQWASLGANALAFFLLLKIVSRVDKTRLIISSYVILGSFCCCASVAVLAAGGEPSLKLVSDVVLVMSRVACTAAVIFNYVYVIELFPTPTRGLVVSLSFASGRLGGVVGALSSALARIGRDDLLFLLISTAVYSSAYSFRYLPQEHGTYARLAHASTPASAESPMIEAMKQTLKSAPKRKQNTRKPSASSGRKRDRAASPVH